MNSEHLQLRDGPTAEHEIQGEELDPDPTTPNLTNTNTFLRFKNVVLQILDT